MEQTDLTRLPVFVGGFRSGSTLLINLLGLHTDIAPWYETKCLMEALRWIKVLDDPGTIEIERALANPAGEEGFSPDTVYRRMCWHARYTHDRLSGAAGSGKGANERYPIGSDCVGYSLDEVLERLEEWRRGVMSGPITAATVAEHTGRLIRRLGMQHLQRQGGRIWINKTPESPRFAPELRRCLGECRFIHLIRDGREVALSGANLNWGSPGRIAHYWAGMIRQSREAAAGHAQHYLEVRYEDLTADPAGEVAKILIFLGAAADPGLVERYQAAGAHRICADSRAFKLGDDEKSRETLAEIEEAAYHMLRELGYL